MTKLKSILLAIITIMITYLLIIFPEESIHASVRGLTIWWKIVFPALLPFFITAELLISFGVVQFIGVLFQPIMRPLFNVPGIGSFAWMIGMASGNPSGAKISARLREENELTQIEAERLTSFSNASSPLFIFGAISIGFFQQPALGMFIAFCHYTSNILVGICMRFYGRSTTPPSKTTPKRQFSFFQALKKMHQTRVKETRPFGQIIGDAVVTSVQTLIMIGGFIMLFSVLTTFLHLIHLTTFIETLVQPLLLLFHIPVDVVIPLLTGVFEITMGIEKAADLSSISHLGKLIIVSFILGFNGFSVQAQVASILARTDIRFTPYFFARILHGIFASILTFALYNTFFPTGAQESFLQLEQEPFHNMFELTHYFGPVIALTSILITICILLSRLIKAK